MMSHKLGVAGTAVFLIGVLSMVWGDETPVSETPIVQSSVKPLIDNRTNLVASAEYVAAPQVCTLNADGTSSCSPRRVKTVERTRLASTSKTTGIRRRALFRSRSGCSGRGLFRRK